MPSYGYEAIDKMGKSIKGSIEADGIELARLQLKQQGNVVVSITEQNLLTKDINISFGKKVNSRDLSVFCRQFVSMNRAGVSILECLNLLWQQTENPTLSKVIHQIHADVQKGEPLAEAMKRHDKIFPNLMITTVAAGETSGSLDVSMERMAEQFEKTTKTQALVKKAMIYPAVVATVAVIVIIIMLVVVIPRYMIMFDDLGTDLPGLTKAVVTISNFLLDYWFLIIPLVAGVSMLIGRYLHTSSGRLLTSRIAIKIPIFHNLVVKSSCSHLARTLCTLLSAGVPLIEAVEITANTMQNVLFYKAMMEAKDAIIKGAPLSEQLQESGMFPPMVYHMIRIGEESGNTEEMLTKLADYYDEEVEMATQSLMAAMEPVIILVLAVFVFILIGACMLPMLEMYNALDNL